MRRRLPAAAIAIAAFLFPSHVLAQRFSVTGPSECINCHDHEAERTWYEKQEMAEVRRLFPDKGANAGHINALKQLETPKSSDYAKAIGLKDKYDLKGACVTCHATVFSGDANGGVTCESCHGPGSGYLKPHQTKGAYDQSVAQYGMTKLVGNIAGWAQQCNSCHVVTDQRLVAAGHSSGADFDLSKKYAPVSLHFKKKYSAADVAPYNKKPGAAAAAPPVASPVAPVAPPPSTPVAPPPPVPSVVPQTTNNSKTIAAPAVSAKPAAVPTLPAKAAPAPAPVVEPPPPLPAPIAPPPPSAAPPPVSGSLPAGVALVQGKLIAALTALLRDGASAPIHTSTPSPALTPYSGPDAALIELQREAIALALETLGQAPAPPASR